MTIVEKEEQRKEKETGSYHRVMNRSRGVEE